MNLYEALNKIEQEPWFIQWLTNVSSTCQKGERTSNLVSGLFSWCSTPESDNFWRAKHDAGQMTKSYPKFIIMERIRERYYYQYPELFI